MLSLAELPALNALLNASSAILLLIGYVSIRRKRVAAHKFVMGAAFLVSVLFLISYLIYHLQVGSQPFPGRGWVRPVYFTILISHIVLAAAILPLALLTLARALRGHFERHRQIARWTLPLWLYVSVTGVVIYCMPYHA